MDYPTIEAIEAADRIQIYRWFLTLPFPRLIKDGKGKGTPYVWVPAGGREVMKRIYEKWQGLGGSDEVIRNKILDESLLKRESGKSQ
jgi:hypothetical protein